MSSTGSKEDLAAGFEQVDDDEWRAAASQNDDADAAPETEIEPGLSAKWLYTPTDRLAPDPAGLPGHSPFTRGGRAGRPWLIRQECRQADRARANAEILEDLNGGTGGIELRLDEAARGAHDPKGPEFAATRGSGGAAVSTLDDLAQVLDGVYMDLAPVALDAGPAAIPGAALLAGVWRQNGIASRQARGSLRLDPLATLAASGRLPRSPREELALAAAVAAEVDREYDRDGSAAGAGAGAGANDASVDSSEPARPAVTALAVDTAPYVNAGASATWELAIALASGVEYLRACETAGLAPNRAAARLEFTLSIGSDQFLEIAKFRAIRRLWARVLEASGVPERERWSLTFGRTADRMLTALDPWTNMLRGTTAAFAAGLGGADGVTVAAFDRDYATETAGPDQVATPNRLGRRISRNTQIVLQEESSLGRLADPAAGSWYAESLTDELSQAAWQRFGEIERQGGALEALTSGWIAEQLAGLADKRQGELARRERLMTGVNIFPLLGDDRVEIEAQDRVAAARVDVERLVEKPGSARLDELAAAAQQIVSDPSSGAGLFSLAVSLAEGGARIDELAAALAGEPYEIEPLSVRRDADAFERLRAAARAHEEAGGESPAILLACLGPIARHVGAANWAKSFFEAGGIEARSSVEVAAAKAAAEGRVNGAELEKGEAKVPAPEELGDVLAASGARIAAICAGRAQTPESIADAIGALREAGADYIYLATPTAEQAEGAAADEIVRDGVDMVAVLSAALNRLGVDLDAAVQVRDAGRPQLGQLKVEGGSKA